MLLCYYDSMENRNYINERDKRYSFEALHKELERKQQAVEGLIAENISAIMERIRTLAIGQALDIQSSTLGEGGTPKTSVKVTRENEGEYSIFTYYIGLKNHKRGPCMGVGEMPQIPGGTFMGLGGNSKPPETGFSSLKRRSVF